MIKLNIPVIVVAVLTCSSWAVVGQLPSRPEWLKLDLGQPEWLLRVQVTYDDYAPLSNRWATLKQMEQRISHAVREGVSPSEDRQKLIKYLTLFAEDIDVPASAQNALGIEIAATYERLGDYRRAAAKYFEYVAAHPEDGLSLDALACQYERLGDTNSAIEIYRFMLHSFESGTMGADLGQTRDACLRGLTNDFTLRKPEWWNQYEDHPMWWSNSAVKLPHTTCFRDAFDYISSGMQKIDDRKALPKAWALLLDFAPITCSEKILTLKMAAVAYSRIGDHHRAIECAWQIPEKFSADTSSSTNALGFIASEFEKLGEQQQAQQVRRSIVRFSQRRN